MTIKSRQPIFHTTEIYAFARRKFRVYEGIESHRKSSFVHYRYAEAKLVTKEHRWYKDELAKEGEDFSDISKIPVGGRIKFYPLLELIEKEIEANGGNYKPVVAKFFPTVSDGLVASLLHGLIHLGEVHSLSFGSSSIFQV